MRIIHISGDHPDPLQRAKTPAVRNLLALLPHDRHIVYSLNRIAPWGGIHALDFDRDNRAVAYGAPRFGLFHETYLLRLAAWIVADLKRRDVSAEVVHAHKLTIEALVGDRVARELGIPLIISSQGNTDLKIIRAKPGLREVFGKLWRRAAWVFPFAPWTTDALIDQLGPRIGPIMELPCPTLSDRLIAPRVCGPVVRTVLRLDDHVNKNTELVIRAVSRAAEQVPGLRLEVVGSGAPEVFARLSRLANSVPAPVSLTGAVPNEDVQGLLNRTACMVLPSKRESYGMVFAEALMAGCPVIHGAGNGIAGYFNDAKFAQASEDGGVNVLAKKIVSMVTRENEIKDALRKAQRAGRLEFLTRPVIGLRYMTALQSVAGRVPASLAPAKVAHIARNAHRSNLVDAP